MLDTEFNEVCTQFYEKPAIHLPSLPEQAFVFLGMVILCKRKIYCYVRNSILGIDDESNLTQGHNIIFFLNAEFE